MRDVVTKNGNSDSRGGGGDGGWGIHDFLSSNIGELQMIIHWWIFRRRLRRTRVIKGLQLWKLLKAKEARNIQSG